jgi:hypothetical protein
MSGCTGEIGDCSCGECTRLDYQALDPADPARKGGLSGYRKSQYPDRYDGYGNSMAAQAATRAATVAAQDERDAQLVAQGLRAPRVSRGIKTTRAFPRPQGDLARPGAYPMRHYSEE